MIRSSLYCNLWWRFSDALFVLTDRRFLGLRHCPLGGGWDFNGVPGR
ncbi:hypothetical protein THTE_3257 [Thermogutta terrifontis]|uniref:Uncharacterized protein n=1 Tax=Thermogutta terrifontis TaxID=1331910 RepID=A0A286RIS4_9BACT|nr:hypothetical protein THTE_3257 [Thermogutta terrifontis]